MHETIKALRPDWHDPEISKGAIKAVMTASDEQHLQPHHSRKQQQKDLEKRFKDPADPLKM